VEVKAMHHAREGAAVGLVPVARKGFAAHAGEERFFVELRVNHTVHLVVDPVPVQERVITILTIVNSSNHSQSEVLAVDHHKNKTQKKWRVHARFSIVREVANNGTS
jgi:hypothetical protein